MRADRAVLPRGSRPCTARITDVRGRAADAIAEEVRGTAYPSHRALLEEADVDAVLVCTPPVTHPEIVLQAIERGRHVLCEKPLAIDVQSASEMVAAADRAGVVFTMGAKFRFVDDVIRAQQIVRSGILGELIVLENSFASRVDMTRGPRGPGGACSSATEPTRSTSSGTRSPR